MDIKSLLIEWNQKKWEEKNRMMYSSVEQNIWPWYSNEADPDVLQYLQVNLPIGARILDLGTCSGGQAIALAELGYQVVGTDISETALQKAELAAKSSGLDSVQFLFDDITCSRLPDAEFDVILDRGCFHSICCFAGVEYVQQVLRLLKPEGVLLLKTMSDQEHRFVEYNQIGSQKIPMPYHFSPQQLRRALEGYFKILAIHESYFYSQVTTPPARAYLSIMKPLVC